MCENADMYVIAILGDIASVIPFVNIVSDFITALALGIAGAESGVNIYSQDEVGWTLATIAVEFMPGLAAIPTWTIRVYFAKRAAKKRKQLEG